jgi:hypothetical protein
VGEFGRKNIGPCGQPDPVQGGERQVVQVLILSGRFPTTKTVAVVRLCGHRDVFDGAKIRKHRADLIGARQTEQGASVDGKMRDVPAKEFNSAGVRLELSDQLIVERRLAGAVRADDGMYFSLGNIEIYAVADHICAEALCQPACRQRRSGHSHSLERFSQAMNEPYTPRCAKSATNRMIGPSTIIQCCV